MKDQNDAAERQESNLAVGRNAVMEALGADVDIDKIFMSNRPATGSLTKIVAIAKQRGIVVKQVDDQKLAFLCGTEHHQGVVASISCARYSSVEEIIERAKDRGEQPFVILLDGIEDPHNLGALIRTAEAAGAHGVIIPKRRSATLTPIVQKTSAGAVNHLAIAKVSNLVSTIDELKKQGIWFYAAEMDGVNWNEQDFSGPCGLVIGSEGEGVSRLVLEHCDFLVSLPMLGKVNSLNASVAGGILMYEIVRQRAQSKSK